MSSLIMQLLVLATKRETEESKEIKNSISSSVPFDSSK
jgi:hypothetical protein